MFHLTKLICYARSNCVKWLSAALVAAVVVAVGGGVADWRLATGGAALVLPVSHGSIREALSNLRVNRRSSHLLCVLTCVKSQGEAELINKRGRERQGRSETAGVKERSREKEQKKD